MRLADDPVQLQNGNQSGANWLVSSGVLIVPSDISQITAVVVPFGAVVSLDGTGSAVQDASGHNALSTLSSVGSTAVLVHVDSASLTVAQSLTSQGTIDASGSLAVNGTYTQQSGAFDEHGRLAQRHVSDRSIGIDARRKRNSREFDHEQRQVVS